MPVRRTNIALTSSLPDGIGINMTAAVMPTSSVVRNARTLPFGRNNGSCRVLFIAVPPRFRLTRASALETGEGAGIFRQVPLQAMDAALLRRDHAAPEPTLALTKAS